MKTPTFLLAAACLMSAAWAQQPSIFIDVGSLAFGSGIPSNGYAAAAPVGGQWNGVDADDLDGQTTFTTAPLMDINGAATLVTATFDALNLDFFPVEADELNTTGDDEALLDDIIAVGGPSEIRFDGLPSGDYDVYTYAMAPDGDDLISSIDVLNSSSGIQNVGGDFAAGFVLGTTHAVHTVAVTAGQPLVIRVDIFAFDDSVNGVQILASGGNGGLGMSYCGPAVTNGSGSPARLVATGSAVAANNNLEITCLDMPAQVFGFFLVSSQQGFVVAPGTSAGNLCLSGALGRYVGPGQIQSSGAQGEYSLLLDLTSTPQPLGSVSIQAGQTWNFQSWFRDTSISGTSSNFSSGLEIIFS